MIHALKSSPKQRLLALIVGILTCLSASYGRSEEDSPEPPWLSPAGLEDPARNAHAGGVDQGQPALQQQTPHRQFHDPGGPDGIPGRESNELASRSLADERNTSAVRLVALQGFAVGVLVSLFLVLIALFLLVLANGRLVARQTVPQSQSASEADSTTKESPIVAHDSPTTRPAEPPKPARSTVVTGQPVAPVQGRSERGGVFQHILEQNIQLRRVFYADTAG
jgi:hypothetical protein